jgi:hypothetical protein
MPLSKHVADVVKGLEFNLVVFGEADWGPETRKRLIDESIELLDEILLDPAFAITLQLAHDAKVSPEQSFATYISGGAALLGFLEKERLLLAGGGFPEDYVVALVNQTRHAVEQGLSGLSRPEEVFQAIVRMKFALVKARDVEHRSGWVKAARALAISFGGAGLVTLNATGWAVSLGIMGPLAALSAAAGGAILGEGAKDVLTLLPGS